MSPKLRTRDVERSLYANYLKRADECLRAAHHSFAEHDWNAASINAIHACIAACDALCVYFVGKRHAGEDHDGAVTLFRTIKPDDEAVSRNANRLIRILRTKNMAEYEERLVRKSEAEQVLGNCERFLEYARKELP